MWPFHEHMYGWGPWGIIVMLVFWLLVIAGAVALIRYWMNGRREPGERTSLRILEERYARGEISREEFIEKRKDLVS